VFDSSTGLMRGRLENGNWVKNLNPQFPYYEYMYREANAWQSSFFAPHDTQGLIHLYKNKEDFENHLDSLFQFRGTLITLPRTSTVSSDNTVRETSRITDLPTSTTLSANRKNRRPSWTPSWIVSMAWVTKVWRCAAWTPPAKCRPGMSSMPLASIPILQPMRITLFPCRFLTGLS
jgi:hypothetical protein